MKERDLKAFLEKEVSSGRCSHRAASTAIRHNRRGGDQFNNEAGFKEFADGAANLSLTQGLLGWIASLVKPKRQHDGD